MSQISNLIPHKRVVLDTGPLLYLLLHNYHETGSRNVRGDVDAVENVSLTEYGARSFVEALGGKTRIITPHILTEASNQAEGTNYPVDVENFLDSNKKFIEGAFDEHYIEKAVALEKTGLRLGIADCTIEDLAVDEEITVISTDEDLIGHLRGHDVYAIGLSVVIQEDYGGM